MSQSVFGQSNPTGFELSIGSTYLETENYQRRAYNYCDSGKLIFTAFFLALFCLLCLSVVCLSIYLHREEKPSFWLALELIVRMSFVTLASFLGTCLFSNPWVTPRVGRQWHSCEHMAVRFLMKNHSDPQSFKRMGRTVFICGTTCCVFYFCFLIYLALVPCNIWDLAETDFFFRGDVIILSLGITLAMTRPIQYVFITAKPTEAQLREAWEAIERSGALTNQEGSHGKVLDLF